MSLPSKILAANWKLNKSPAEARSFLKDFASQSWPDFKYLFFPSALSANVFSGQKYEWGLQNAYFESTGAFTGENSMSVAKDMGARWVLIGHSERRSLFQETDLLLRKKLMLAHALGLKAMLCIGETLAERENQSTTSVLKTQLQQALMGFPLAESGSNLVVAYEPVWAIGTGKVASSAQVQEAHQYIHEVLEGLGFTGIKILYGGSVKGDNAKELSALNHVSGFLVGGASLKTDSFSAIAKAMV